jgi:hypothetical protein
VDTKTVELQVRPSTWASIENMARFASEKTGKTVTPEEAAATVLEVGLRGLAQDIRARGGDENIRLARALLNFHAPTACDHHPTASIAIGPEEPA